LTRTEGLTSEGVYIAHGIPYESTAIA